MKHVRLFEQFLNEAKMSKELELLIDVLSNLEDEFTEEEFIEFGISEVELPANVMMDIWDTYWDLDARLRLKWTTKEWADWLKKVHSVK